MPVADYKTCGAMLDRARTGRFALPAANVTSLATANAVLRELAGAAMTERVKQAASDLRGAGKWFLCHDSTVSRP
jgi:fructose/tagatose bisphosphate aldolase